MIDMAFEQLAALHGIPGRIELTHGQGGLPCIDIHNAAADARISLYGGQVLSFRPAGSQDERLFLSERAHYAEGKAIKGGIPICWPWFGADPDHAGRPAHGFARTALWDLQEVSEPGTDLTRVTLALRDDERWHALWPHAFELQLVIDIGSHLGLAMTTINRGHLPFQLSQAFHTYFAVGDIADVSVDGLQGLDYLDKPRAFERFQQVGAVTFAGEVDRIYQAVAGSVRIDDSGLKQRVDITGTGSRTAVVWNPWADISAAMGDLTDDAYRRFVCVETANAADDVVTLGPGMQHTLAAVYRWSGL